MTTMYTVFGCLKSEDQPEVRVDDVDVPDAELTDGIQHAQVAMTYGDDPEDAFLRVAAVDLQAAKDAYDRLFHAVKLILPWLWGGPTPTVRVELTDAGEELLRLEIPMDLVGWLRKDALDEGGLGLRGMVMR
jgi:hypothetical protein